MLRSCDESGPVRWNKSDIWNIITPKTSYDIQDCSNPAFRVPILLIPCKAFGRLLLHCGICATLGSERLK